MSSSEISSTSLANPFRESGTPRNWKSSEGLAKLPKFPYLTENWNRQKQHLSFVSACVGLTTFSTICMPHYFPSTQNLTSELRATREFVLNCTLSKWLITCHRSLTSINNVWDVGGSAIVDGLLLEGSWFSGRWFFCPLPTPLPLLALSTLNPAQT